MILLEVLLLAAALLGSYGIALNTAVVWRAMQVQKPVTVSLWPYIIASLAWAAFIVLWT